VRMFTSALAAVVSALRLAVRRLRRAPIFSLTVVATFALGLGISGAMFGLVNGILIQPLPYPDPNRLVELKHTGSRVDLPMTGISPGLADHYRAHNRVFEDIGVYVEHVRTLTDLAEPERARVALVTPQVFSLLRPAAVAGRIPGPGDFEWGGERRALISHALWARRYGARPDLIGQTIEIDRGTVRVVGVAESGFHFPHPETEVWIAWGWPLEVASRASLRALTYGGIARLKQGTSFEVAEQDLERLIRTLPDAFSDVTNETLQEIGFRAQVVPLKQAIVGDVSVPLLLLQGAAVFLLLITWANSTNITLVRCEALRRDIVVSRALGAGEGHLALRFVSEALVLALVGGALGSGLAASAIKLRFGFAPDDIPRLREVSVDAAVLGLILALSLLSAALLGGVGIWSAKRSDPVGVLGGGMSRFTPGRREERVRRLLVSAQVALALTLMIGSALMARSFWRLRQVRPGFETEGALTFRLPIPTGVYGGYHGSARLHDDVLRGLRTIPGVDAVEAGHVSTFPLMTVPSYYRFRVTVANRGAADPAEPPWALLGFATPGYFQAMGIPLLRGRTFRTEDTGRAEHGVVLSASLARSLFGDEDPIGRHVRWVSRSRAPDFLVVGVVGDVVGQDMRDAPSAAFYLPNIYPPKADTITGIVHDYIPFDEVYVMRTRLPAASLLPAIHQVVRGADPKLVVTHVATLDALVADSMARTRLTMLLLFVGTAAAVFLGVIGIYGVLSYTVSLRSSELGIRLALGASPTKVALMVVRQGALDAGVGIAAGVIAATGLTRYLRTLLYEVSPTDAVTFGAMAALLLAVALLASYAPARRAGRIDPIKALQEG
jgi:putative ABC transport system permease protein